MSCVTTSLETDTSGLATAFLVLVAWHLQLTLSFHITLTSWATQSDATTDTFNEAVFLSDLTLHICLRISECSILSKQTHLSALNAYWWKVSWWLQMSQSVCDATEADQVYFYAWLSPPNASQNPPRLIQFSPLPLIFLPMGFCPSVCFTDPCRKKNHLSSPCGHEVCVIRLNASAQAFLLPLSYTCNVCDSVLRVLYTKVDVWLLNTFPLQMLMFSHFYDYKLMPVRKVLSFLSCILARKSLTVLN